MTVASLSSAAANVADETAARPRAQAEAARYGVLRRLAPALKHDMVVNLQAVAMMADVLNARLEKGAPSPADFQKTISKINRLAREAVLDCLKVAAWIEPAEDEAIVLREGVDECVALLQSNFGFRGFTLASQVPEGGFEVSRVLLRHVLVASLISLTDEADGPGDVRVEGQVDGGWATLTVRCARRAADGMALPFEANYRALDWADVQALATADAVELERSPGRIDIRLPRMVASGPVGIAPL